MTCHQLGDGMVVCTTSCIAIRRKIFRCPGCKQRRRFTCYDEAWYGQRVVCNTCGLTASDGYRMRQGKAAAKHSAAKARADWLTPFDNSRAYWAQYQEAEA